LGAASLTEPMEFCRRPGDADEMDFAALASAYWRYAPAGFLAGAIFTVSVMFMALQLNLKGLRTVYDGVRQDAVFYASWAIAGGVIGAVWAPPMLVLEATQLNEPWLGLAMIATGLMALFAVIRFQKRRRT
jgi:hypothetical protein